MYIIRIRQKAAKYIIYIILIYSRYNDNSSLMFASREYMNTVLYTELQLNNNRMKEN